ncbi:MAG: sugar ABC transporter permease [Oscillospiraceae bacterium]|nr:sugar ABC transporter permease [Oscillospiraceae bacterium]
MLTGKSTKSTGVAVKAGSGNRERRHLSLEKGHVAYIMIAPFIIVFCIFSLYTVIYTLYIGFTNLNVLKPTQAKFVGLDNFERFFKNFLPKNLSWEAIKESFDYQKFSVQKKSIVNTWKIWLVNYIPQLGIAMLLSVWFSSSFLKIKLIGFWRSLLYMPNLLMPATVGVIFFKLFQDRMAPANQFMVGVLGVWDEGFEFLMNETFSQMLISFIQWWMWYGNTIVILVAGMSSISVSLYESAMIDGAGGVKMFRYITLPSLRPILVYTLVTSLVGGMQMFDIPYLISAEGNPRNSITTIYCLMQRQFQIANAAGSAAAIGIILLLMTTLCSMLIFFLLRDKDAGMERKASRAARKERALRLKGGRA